MAEASAAPSLAFMIVSSSHVAAVNGERPAPGRSDSPEGADWRSPTVVASTPQSSPSLLMRRRSMTTPSAVPWPTRTAPPTAMPVGVVVTRSQPSHVAPPAATRRAKAELIALRRALDDGGREPSLEGHRHDAPERPVTRRGDLPFRIGAHPRLDDRRRPEASVTTPRMDVRLWYRASRPVHPRDVGPGKQDGEAAVNGRERILAALDGEVPDRVPRALAFYHVDVGAPLAPPGAWRDGLVDVEFVSLPPFARGGAPAPSGLAAYEGDSWIGKRRPGGRLRSLWHYRPADPRLPNPLEAVYCLSRIWNAFRSPRASGTVRGPGHGPRQVQDLHAPGWQQAGTFPTWAASCSRRPGGSEASRTSSSICLAARSGPTSCSTGLLSTPGERRGGRAGRHGRACPRRRRRHARRHDDQPGALAGFFRPRMSAIIVRPRRQARPPHPLPQRRRLRRHRRRPGGARGRRHQPAPA